MKKSVFLIFLFLPACASAKGGPLSGLFTAKVADEVKVADKVTGVERMENKVADKAEARANSSATF